MMLAGPAVPVEMDEREAARVRRDSDQLKPSMFGGWGQWACLYD